MDLEAADQNPEQANETPNIPDETSPLESPELDIPVYPPAFTDSSLPLPILWKDDSRDVYDLGDYFLSVSTDRMSVKGVAITHGIPDKGYYSTQTSAYWLERTRYTVPNNLKAVINDLPQLDEYIPQEKRFEYPAELAGRCAVYKKTEALPVTVAALGHLTEEVWQEYKTKGTVFGKIVINGLLESQSIPGAAFVFFREVPESKPEQIEEGQLESLVGVKAASDILKYSNELFNHTSRYTRVPAGYYVAGMKFTFGTIGRKTYLTNEAFSPDNTCYWDVNTYRVGRTHFCYHEQAMMGWLMAQNWNKYLPMPEIPVDIIEQTSQKYRQLCERLTGKKFQ